MTIFLIISNIVFVGLFSLAITQTVQYRKRLHKISGKGQKSPISTVPLEEFCELFLPGGHGVPMKAEIFFVGAGETALGRTSDTEAWVLAVLSKKAKYMFEFGTASGRTSYLWAKNSSSESSIYTITLHPEQHGLYKSGSIDDQVAGECALKESAFDSFAYSGTDVAKKINQLFGDSKEFDEASYPQMFDLIFIDGSHSYSYVKSDTEKAFRMLKPGGTIVWHDYRNDLAHTKGVYDYLNELSLVRKVQHLEHTTMVAFKNPS